MALEAPLRSSLQFPFGSPADMSASPEPERLRSPGRVVSSPPPATDSASLRPHSANRFSSQSMHVMSPSDIVGPSPVTSNGTETTEIEDDATEEVRRASTLDEGPERRRSGALLLTTALPDSKGGHEGSTLLFFLLRWMYPACMYVYIVLSGRRPYNDHEEMVYTFLSESMS
jgi:hypothetical protein